MTILKYCVALVAALVASAAATSRSSCRAAASASPWLASSHIFMSAKRCLSS